MELLVYFVVSVALYASGLIHGNIASQKFVVDAALRKDKLYGLCYKINIDGTCYYVIEETHLKDDWQRKPAPVNVETTPS